MFGKPECDVLQPEPHSGEACNTLSHKGLTNVNIQKGMLYCHCYIVGLLGYCIGGNFNFHIWGVVQLFQLLKNGNQVLSIG